MRIRNKVNNQTSKYQRGILKYFLHQTVKNLNSFNNVSSYARTAYHLSIAQWEQENPVKRTQIRKQLRHERKEE